MAKTSSLTSAMKEKWSPCLTVDLMSSEESESDYDDENERCGDIRFGFIVRPLPWRSDRVTNFVLSLDQKFYKNQTKRSQMMMQKREKGLPSDRPQPDSLPDWCVKTH